MQGSSLPTAVKRVVGSLSGVYCYLNDTTPSHAYLLLLKRVVGYLSCILLHQWYYAFTCLSTVVKRVVGSLSGVYSYLNDTTLHTDSAARRVIKFG